MKYIILPFALGLTTFITSCSMNAQGLKDNSLFETQEYNQSTIKEVRKISAFEGIDISSAIAVNVSDNHYNGNITITAPDKAMEKIKTQVSNGILKIYVDGNLNLYNSKITVDFPHQKLRKITLSGASSFNANHVMKVDKFGVNVSGASLLKANLISNKILMEASGASKVFLKGNVQELAVKATGASKFEGEELKAAKVVVDASGASNAKVWAVDQLSVDASGASKVSYQSQKGLKTSIDKSGASKVTTY